MKILPPILILLVAIAILTTCKKTPETPSGNKIEIGETTIDSLGYYGIKLSTLISGVIGNNIENMGYCWNNDGIPTLDDNVITANYNDSSIITTLPGLSDGQQYKIRPYVITSNNTIYGNEVVTSTLATNKPIVTTSDVYDITINSATCGGTNDDGGLTLSQRGVCWNTSGNPTLENSTGKTTEGNVTGSFISNVTGLLEGEKYNIVAYATNTKGTGYGDVLSFETLPITPPTVTTTEITDITVTSATGGGNITDNGNSTVIASGICWNTSGDPTLENNLGFTTNSSGIGTFISQLTNLSENTTYYVSAYATNEKGMSYGDVMSFTTLVLSLPEITTIEPINITDISAVCGGDVTSAGNGNVLERGVCWSTNNNPTLSDNYLTIGSGIGSFEGEITGLAENSIYYVRAYATNEKGTNYGELYSFNTTGCFVPEISTTEGTVFSPADGASITAGSSVEITWEKGSGGGQLHIYLYKNNKYILGIYDWAVNDGSFDFYFPDTLDESDCYQIVMGYQWNATPPGDLPNNDWGTGYIVGSYFTIK